MLVRAAQLGRDLDEHRVGEGGEPGGEAGPRHGRFYSLPCRIHVQLIRLDVLLKCKIRRGEVERFGRKKDPTSCLYIGQPLGASKRMESVEGCPLPA